MFGDVGIVTDHTNISNQPAPTLWKKLLKYWIDAIFLDVNQFAMSGEIVFIHLKKAVSN